MKSFFLFQCVIQLTTQLCQENTVRDKKDREEVNEE